MAFNCVLNSLKASSACGRATDQSVSCRSKIAENLLQTVQSEWDLR